MASQIIVVRVRLRRLNMRFRLAPYLLLGRRSRRPDLLDDRYEDPDLDEPYPDDPLLDDPDDPLVRTRCAAPAAPDPDARSPSARVPEAAAPAVTYHGSVSSGADAWLPASSAPLNRSDVSAWSTPSPPFSSWAASRPSSEARCFDSFANVCGDISPGDRSEFRRCRRC
jgi:hypothetical protein